jgi:hypothetical protein
MQATARPQIVKTGSPLSGDKHQQTNTAARPASAPKAGPRFLDFLMTALAGCAV